MARARAYTREELLDATEQLIVIHGYDSFRIKLLSDTLSGARSTIYEYFSNKEEIIAACMRRSMDNILQACAGLEQLDALTAIKQMLYIFLERADMHKIVSMVPKVNHKASDKVQTEMKILDQGHERLKHMIQSLFERARAEGLIRADIPLPVMTAVFFHAIDTPNWMKLPTEQWAELLFSIWWNGGSSENS
jgi:AcrR family transcriptional regulator